MTYIFILLDALHDPGRQRRVSDREVRCERHIDLPLQELHNNGVVWVGAEEVACDHGKGEVVLAVQRRKLLEGSLELTIEAAQYDAVEQSAWGDGGRRTKQLCSHFGCHHGFAGVTVVVRRFLEEVVAGREDQSLDSVRMDGSLRLKASAL